MDTTVAPLASIGIDIGKEVFHLVGFGTDGKIAFRRKIKRLALVETFKKLPQSIIGLEACLSAHFVSRVLRRLGHEPRIIPAIYMKPFVKGRKNDYNDAEAIAEAALRPNLRAVREKSQDQLDLQACHRVRSRLVSRRTATINRSGPSLSSRALRGQALVLCGPPSEILKNCEDEISPRMSDLIVGLYEDWLWLDERIETITREIEEISSARATGPADERARRWPANLDRGCGCDRYRRSLRPRSGLLCLARAGAAAVQCRRAIDPGRYLQEGQPIPQNPLHPSCQGAADATAELAKVQLRPVAHQCAPRMHRNKLATALANKLARIAWSVLNTGKAFDTHLQLEAI